MENLLISPLKHAKPLHNLHQSHSEESSVKKIPKNTYLKMNRYTGEQLGYADI